MKNSIFYDNNVKYCVVDLTLDNTTLSLATTAVENEALISFKAVALRIYSAEFDYIWQRRFGKIFYPPIIQCPS
ncbi:hypothetical protein E7747_00005 [Duncaniella dubosii]|uniref:Uncharacterized protein n=1 Tax=Duncaniella dubosii TaxID=2518971 RepID=A0A4P7VZ49_9BACT|nr:hypothetical protein [Duncaniella dubosii]QCD40836.1 hypothetical protein E7747_00005 [Duncaniella dubosii]